MFTLKIMSIFTSNNHKINQLDTTHFLHIICLHFYILQMIWHTVR